MSGHSKWSTIKRQKSANDAKKGQVFTKIANAITMAAKASNSSDIDSNPKLRMILEQARAINLPKENIQRAIDRGLGKLPGQTLEEITFEGFGSAKAAFIVETVTDNRMRTTQEIRNIFERAGGAFGAMGSATYMFDRVGEIVVQKSPDEDSQMLALMDLGVEDIENLPVEEDVPELLVYTKPNEVTELSNKITQLGYTVISADLSFKPNIVIDINDQSVFDKLEELRQKLEDNADAQAVYANYQFLPS